MGLANPVIGASQVHYFFQLFAVAVQGLQRVFDVSRHWLPANMLGCLPDRVRAVWCGVVWCGVVWCGVVWCGVVWCGVVWCGVVWCVCVCVCVCVCKGHSINKETLRGT